MFHIVKSSVCVVSSDHYLMMLTQLQLLFCVILVFGYGDCFFRPIGKTVPIKEGDNPGKPLFLTPLLNAGKFKKAQKLSKVKPDIGNTTSYSGFFTVDEECGNNLFFWFFPAQNNWQEAPTLLWLQGGPGATSMYGLFTELGPFSSHTNGGLRQRRYSWNVQNNLLFIDQPVGTGYSFTTEDCYPQNETAVGKDLYSAMVQFFQLFPNLVENRFYISGESYAGHYIPALGYAIHTNNPTADVKINLVGMLIGDGWSDPITQYDYGSYLYQLGFVDDSQRKQFYKVQNRFVKEEKAKDWEAASITMDEITGALFTNTTGLDDIYNYLPQTGDDDSNWDVFIQETSTRKAIHAGSLPFQWGDKTYMGLRLDIVKSVKPWIEELLEHYYIVFYNGQVDIICAYPMTIRMVRSLKWSGEKDYKAATRDKWYVDNQLAGYIKGVNHLYDVLVRDAGHMVPTDQPEWAYILVNEFTSTPVNTLHLLSGLSSTNKN